MKKIAWLLAAALCLQSIPVNVLASEETLQTKSAEEVIAEETADEGTCGENVTWAFDEATGTLTISGTGEMTSYGYQNYAPWYGMKVTKLVIGNEVTTIGDWAFYNMSDLKDVTGGENLTALGIRAFNGCKSLTSFDIGEKVESLGMYAFLEAGSLEKVTGGEGVTLIGSGAFDDCTSLTTIPEFKNVTSIKSGAFTNTAWADKQGEFPVINGILTHYNGSSTEIAVPEGIISFADKAIPTKVTKLSLPSTITEIPESAFDYYYSKLESVTFSKGLKTIGASAFSGCKALAEITFPEGLEKIGNSAFRGCTSLKEIVIPDGTYVDTYAFVSCTGITSLVAEGNKTFLGDNSFYNCTSLTEENVSLGKIGFGNNVFLDTELHNEYGNCGSNVMWYLEDGTMTLYVYGESGEMSGSPISSSSKEVIETVKKVVIEDGVTSISSYAFRDYTNMEEISIPDTVTVIGIHALNNTGLSSIDIPDSVTEIGYGAFASNTKLTSLTIPENVTSLGSYIIENAVVTNLVLKANVTYTESTFNNASALENVSIESGSINRAAFYDSKETLKTVKIGAGVTEIGYDAFAGMTALESVIFENGEYTKIGDSAFSRCTLLKEIEIPENVTEIGEYAFRGCTSLNKVVFSEGLETIGKYAFADCTLLKEAEIPNSVTTIGIYAFNAFASDEQEEKEETFVYGDYFLMKGYINTEAERYASRTSGVEFQPLGGDISSCTVTVSPVSNTYDGTAKTPEVTVKTQYGHVLTEGTMYTEPVYSNNVEVGTAEVSVTGITPYTGTAGTTFTISGGSGSGNSGNQGGSGNSSGAIITDEEMEKMYKILMEYGLISDDTSKVGEEELVEIIEIFATFGYETADVYKFLETFGIDYPGGETEEELPFTDVKESDWFFNPVAYAYENGIMKGTGDGTTFEPTKVITRSEIVQMLYNMSGAKVTEEQLAAMDFEDVGNTWYTAAIAWASAEGVVNGTGNGKFNPLGEISREQLAVMLYNYAKYSGVTMTGGADLSTYADVSKVSGWATTQMSWAVGEGLITGKSNSGKITLSATDGASRAEAATVFQRFNENILK